MLAWLAHCQYVGKLSYVITNPANMTKKDIMPEAAPFAAAVSVKNTHTSSAQVVAARRPIILTATNLPKSSPNPHVEDRNRHAAA